MSNDYYNASSLISTLSKASSKFVNAALSAIAAGFEKLPGEAALKQNRVNFATDTGTANAKTMTLTHAISSYVDGAALAVKIGEANTGACTMDWGPGARSVVHVDGSAMQPGDLGAGQLHTFRYDATSNKIVLQTPVERMNLGLATITQQEADSTEIVTLVSTLGLATRAALVSLVAAGMVWPDGAVVRAGGVAYQWDSSAAIEGCIAGLKPYGQIDVRHFGSVGDCVFDDDDELVSGTNDWTAFQSAINYANSIGGGVVFVPHHWGGQGYRLGQALKAKNSVRFVAESPMTRFYTTGDAPSTPGANGVPNNNSWMFGSWTAGNYTKATAYALDSVTAGAETCTATTAGDAANFADGDVVFVRSTSTYQVGGLDRPLWGQLNVVVGTPAAGAIGLRYPLLDTGAAEIVSFSDDPSTWEDADGTDSLEQQFATRDFQVIGGWWSTEANGAMFASGGGAIDCVIAPHRITCRSGVAYGNLFAHTLFTCDVEETWKAGTELSICSHDCIVRITSAVNRADRGLSAADAAVWLDGNSRRNLVQIGTLNCGTFDHGDAVQFLSCQDNRVEIGTLYARAVTGALVRFLDASYTGTKPTMKGNSCRIGNGYGGAGTYYVQFTGNGNMGPNVCEDSRFWGAVSSGALQLNGNDGSGCTVRNVICEYGGITVANSRGFSVQGHFPDGISRSSHFDTEYAYGRFDITTTASRLLRQVAYRAASNAGITATSGSPFTITRSIPIGGLNPGDEIAFDLIVAVRAGSTSDDKTVVMKLGSTAGSGGTTVEAYTSIATTAVNIRIKGVISRVSNTSVCVTYDVSEGTTPVTAKSTDVTVSALDANALEIFFSVQPATDTLDIRGATITPRCAAAGQLAA